MSVKHGMLALLYEQPHHGYEIKTGFDDLVQKKWPLNPGQVYTTLDRLERDGLVDSPGSDEKDRKIYKITDAGKKEFMDWLYTPVEYSLLKNTFYFKWLCSQKVDVGQEKEMVEHQRKTIIKNILQLTKFKQQLEVENEQESMQLLVEGALLHLEADLKWLDMIKKK